MKPIYLSFQGINSFSERADIDFEKILQDGLFGIFGKTGSGKSTIIDCITYALFQKTPRSQNLIEYLNNKGKFGFVDFTFEVADGGERKRYNVRRTIRVRKGGSFDNTSSLALCAGGELRPIPGDPTENIKGILGVSYDEFSKCIALPQNEFAAFVKATRVERLTLVRKLFDLEKYDVGLNAALKERMAKIENEISQIDGELSRYEGYTEERLESLKAARIAKNSLYLSIEAEEEELAEKVRQGYGEYMGEKRFEENLKELAELEGEIDTIEDIKTALKRAADYAEISASLNAAEGAKLKLSAQTAQLDEMIAKREKTASEIAFVRERCAEDRSSKIRAYAVEEEQIKSCAGAAKEIESLRASYLALSSQLKTISERKGRLMREKEDLLKILSSLQSPSERLGKLYEAFASSAIGKEIRGEIEYFDRQKIRLAGHEDDGLYAPVSNEIDRKRAELCLRLENLPPAVAEADEISRVRSLAEKESQIKNKLSEIEKEIAVAESAEKAKAAEIERVNSEGKEKSKRLSDIAQAYGISLRNSNEVETAARSVAAEIKRLMEEQKFFADRERTLNEELSSLGMEIAAAGQKKSAAENELKAAEEELCNKLSASGFKTAEQARAYALDEKTISEYNLRVADHERRLLGARAVHESLCKNRKGDFDARAYEELCEKARQAKAKVTQAASELAALKRDEEDAAARLGEKAEINSRSQAARKKMALCRRLEGVLAGHNLLNFIAEEYLSDIAEGASRTMLDLSGGRYDVIYDKEFFVLDNMSGGDRRPVSTLSGGETFLVSLSLALSLSQAIGMRTMRPVEFFFLDEGFGTLDEELTDTVVSCLDKLRSRNFSIGVISHVPELKQRINSKILVYPATKTEGSKLSVVSD